MKLTEAQELAELVHKKTCHWNHTDGCSWFYESWDGVRFGDSAKSKALETANKMLLITNFETAKAIMSCLD